MKTLIKLFRLSMAWVLVGWWMFPLALFMTCLFWAIKNDKDNRLMWQDVNSWLFTL